MNMPVNSAAIKHVQNENTKIKDPANWQDPKRYGWLLSPGLPLVATALLGTVFPSKDATSGSPLKRRLNLALCYTGPLLIHAVIPMLDMLVGEDESNPPTEAMNRLKADGYYKTIARAFVPLQYAALFVGAHKYANTKLSPLGKIGVALSVGAISGIAINTAHELGHKKGKVDNWLAKIALATTGYGHFVVEHNYGHHKHVSTPLDPASSRFNESFWQFLPRTVIGSFNSAIKIEKARLARRGKHFWSKDNEILQAGAISAGLLTTLIALYGKKILPFALAQGVYGFCLLEVVNYIEHYGLKRTERSGGGFERVRPEHSWNSNHVITNLVLYQLQRHSDHHANPTREYQLLRHFEDTPQLPSGYASMITLAYFPRLWFKVMNPRVLAHYEGDESKLNMYNPDENPLRDALTSAAGRLAGLGLSAAGGLLAKI